ncbi:hypothetical protein CSUI_003821 [Cystoisospora suis]|uniref:Uncharacterized protein n=1 Tax=Cystoisospora suis TaxID=483139 RepID=A0A2C6L3Z6_9APIC|nr:hypothetical protein CSUI_003821 [Cystoisospora suis]
MSDPPVSGLITPATNQKLRMKAALPLPSRVGIPGNSTSGPRFFFLIYANQRNQFSFQVPKCQGLYVCLFFESEAARASGYRSAHEKTRTPRRPVSVTVLMKVERCLSLQTTEEKTFSGNKRS